MTDKPKTHGELVAAGLRDDCDLYGLIPDNYICVDYGMDTWPGHKTRVEIERSMRDAKAAGKRWKSVATYTQETEVYYVHPHVWKASGIGFWERVLCIGCLEKRIGRRLQPFDFMAEHADGFNNPSLPGTRRRFERLMGAETWEGIGDDPAPPPASKLEQALHAAFGGKQWATRHEAEHQTLRQLRRALRREATRLVKFRKEIIDDGLEDHWRWKKWVRGTPPAVHQLLAAAEVLDDAIRLGRTDVLGSVVTSRHANKRKQRSSPQPLRSAPPALRVLQ